MPNIDLLVNYPSKPGCTHHVTTSAEIDAGLFVTYAGALCGAGGVALGVMGELTESGQTGLVYLSGIVPVIAGGNIAVGAEIASDANGKAVTAVSTNYVIGRALKAAASGQPVQIEITKEGVKA